MLFASLHVQYRRDLKAISRTLFFAYRAKSQMGDSLQCEKFLALHCVASRRFLLYFYLVANVANMRPI